ncbi:GMC family oxidoreductase [Microvirga pudoricolor]|uniref:GMC family oxidoreductase n=1 Tax=Microvirga pudoricolor TaxID=2778729 RepID=UPI0019527DAC|nr:GMC family oxidoreductase [Microvirga pudoricolor]MBM6595328.1 gluconate 2-dehydrogenase subunit 3 family protein [Microvirga pudoricolor]
MELTDRSNRAGQRGRLVLSGAEAARLEAIFDRMFPDNGDGYSVRRMGVIDYVDGALAGAESENITAYRRVLDWLAITARTRWSKDATELSDGQLDELVSELERGDSAPAGSFELLRRDLLRGLFSDPIYGGNRHLSGWKFLGHRGLGQDDACPKGLCDWPGRNSNPRPEAFDSDAGRRPPAKNVDIVIVGGGAVGSIVAGRLAQRGLKVVVLEAGPWRAVETYRPDELGQAFYGRAALGPKFNTEVPRWVRSISQTQDVPLTFSLGRMANGVGGSSVLYGARFRRFHPHHFQHFSSLARRGLSDALPDASSLVDWPIRYDDLEPYYTELEWMIGVAGEPSPFTPRSRPLPFKPLRQFRVGDEFRSAATRLGYQPYTIPVGRVGEARDGVVPTYDPWDEGIGAYTKERWTPIDTLLPKALETGNLDLRTMCRVLRIVTDKSGRASGVTYLDPDGREQQQDARVTLVAAYTFETIRLLALSGNAARPDGLGNSQGQLGLSYLSKMFPQVAGQFSDRVFNRHTGPGGQAVIVEDLMAEGAIDWPGTFGGGTLSTENQLLPLQIANDPVLIDAPRWGAGYKQHLRNWNQRASIKIQADAFPLLTNRLLLDPRWRDRSGVGDPVVRVIWDLCEADLKLYQYMQERAEELLLEMGAEHVGRGPIETGVGCCHDLGGARAGDDPSRSVVNSDWQVHDTPGLYVYSGATFPTCPGINPTLTIWAWALRNADRLAKSLGASS